MHYFLFVSKFIADNRCKIISIPIALLCFALSAPGAGCAESGKLFMLVAN